MDRSLLIRWAFFIVGLIILSFGVSMTIEADRFGIGPWDVFHVGLFEQFGLTVGTWSIIAGLVIVGGTALGTKKLPQIGTILNMLLIGVFIDIFTIYVLPTPETFWGNIVMFSLGIMILAYGIGIYVAPGLGAGPRDSLMLLIRDITGWKVQWVRNGIEITVLILGWLLGGPVGIGTILIALFLGTIVGYSLPQMTQWMNRIIERGERYEDLNQGTLRSDYHDRSS
ncbi:membrane protein [Pontibacillus halophilus JSM 076056 = DSM 19796]|uniref:Membrane protein n=1 Tax=Pontibacillus halophilus JSM 076056 = DSM 19796 TaxID=1385510 RepID=A0A0A5GQW5_9BACI|nr:YitT family protein [Pontibacillus halophilus]KGX93525.1 membrane protein [Pontibacillus halophilus JSM 076056 = DSM 19796]